MGDGGSGCPIRIVDIGQIIVALLWDKGSNCVENIKYFTKWRASSI